MARGRIISKSISHSEKINSLFYKNEKLAEFAQLLFTWMIPHTDDFGQLQSSPLGIKLEVMPGSSRGIDDFIKAIEMMADSRLIEIHPSGEVLRIVNFDKFQSFRSDRTKQNKYPDTNWESNDIPMTYQGHTIGCHKISKDKISKEKLSKKNKYSSLRSEYSSSELQNNSKPESEVENPISEISTIMSPRDFAMLWNRYAVNGIPPVKNPEKLSLNRTNHIKARLKENRSIDYWAGVFAKLQKLPFYCGDNNQGWVVDFDWIIRNDNNHVRIHEKTIPRPGGRKKLDAVDMQLAEILEKEGENAD